MSEFGNKIDEGIERAISRLEAHRRMSSETHFTARVAGYNIHIAYSIMGDIKRINVAQDAEGNIPDNEDTEYIISKLREALG